VVTESSRPTRSDERIPKLRRRGRVNRAKLLAEAERLLIERDGEKLRFSDVFEAAGVSRGSAYRIYIGMDDLIQDLAGEWINNFVDTLKFSTPEVEPENWMELSDFIIAGGVKYWAETERTLRAMPRIRANAPASYQNAIKKMTRAIAEIFDTYFVVPSNPDWYSIVGFYVQLGDLVSSDDVRRSGQISEQRLIEAQTLCRTYLSLHLPGWLPKREPRSA